MPPPAAATKNVFDGLGMPAMSATRPSKFAGPTVRHRKPANVRESSVCASADIAALVSATPARRGTKRRRCIRTPKGGTKKWSVGDDTVTERRRRVLRRASLCRESCAKRGQQAENDPSGGAVTRRIVPRPRDTFRARERPLPSFSRSGPTTGAKQRSNHPSRISCTEFHDRQGENDVTSSEDLRDRPRDRFARRFRWRAIAEAADDHRRYDGAEERGRCRDLA